MALRGKTEILQALGIQLKHDGIGGTDEAQRFGPLQIVAIGHLVVTAGSGNLRMPVAIIGFVYFELAWIRLADTLFSTILAAPAGEQADARRTLVLDHVLCIAAWVLCRAVSVVDHAGQLQARSEIEQHVLERPHIAVWSAYRLADRIACAVGVGYRTIQQRHTVVA